MNTILPSNFIKITLITSIWINISEVFRYFVIVMPAMRKELAAIQNVAPMDWWIFSIWGVWDTILTACIVYIAWMAYQVFGPTKRSIFVAGILSWSLFFLLFWIGMVNMNLARPSILLYTLPLSLLETMIGSMIAVHLLSKKL